MKSTFCMVFRIKIVAFDAFLQGKQWYLLSHIGTYSVIPTSYVWDKRFIIYFDKSVRWEFSTRTGMFMLFMSFNVC
jgi:hypothetical protein